MALGWINQAVALVFGLLVTPFYLRHLGDREYGLWAIALQILAYLALTDLGAAAILPREIAAAGAGLPDHERRTRARASLAVALSLSLRQIPFMLVAGIAVWVWMPSGWAALRPSLAIVVLSFAVLYPFRALSSALTGLQDQLFAGLLALGQFLLSNILAVLLIQAGCGLLALGISWVVAQGLTTVATALRLRFLLGTWTFRSSNDERRRFLGRSIWVLVSQVATTLVGATDVLLIGTILGPVAVVPYAMTAKLMQVLANQPQVILHAALPGLAELRVASGGTRALQASSALAQAMLALSGTVACVVVLTNRGFVSWWVGPERFGGTLLTTVLVLSMIGRHLNSTATLSLFSFGNEKRLAITALSDGIVTVAITALSIRLFGLVGAPLGSLVGVSFVSLPLNLLGLRAATGTPLRQISRPLLPVVWRLAFLVAGLSVAARWWTPVTAPMLAIAAGSAAALVLATIARPVLRSGLAAYVNPRFAFLSHFAGVERHDEI